MYIHAEKKMAKIACGSTWSLVRAASGQRRRRGVGSVRQRRRRGWIVSGSRGSSRNWCPTWGRRRVFRIARSLLTGGEILLVDRRHLSLWCERCSRALSNLLFITHAVAVRIWYSSVRNRMLRRQIILYLGPAWAIGVIPCIPQCDLIFSGKMTTQYC